jgi:hypothetical protein
MKKLALALLLLSSTAYAADLPMKTPAAPIAAAYNPFYIGIEGGMGFTAEENVIAQQGVAVGTPKQYPTAPTFGGVVGFLNNTSAIAWGGEIFVDYNLSQGSLNCVAGVCAASSRNSFSFGEDLLLGFTIGQLISASPSNIQPQNWKFPITVPSSVVNNFQLLGSFGGAQRSAGLCASQVDAAGAVIAGTNLCGSEWMGGLSAGAQARFVVAGQWDVAVKYHHNFYNHSFTPTDSIGVFAGTVAAKSEDTFKVGFNYHLSPL